MKENFTFVIPILFLAGTTAAAQENLATSIVKATPTESSSDDMVLSKDLLQSEAIDLNDIFQTTPSVQVNGGRLQAQQIFVNGLESTLSNVTIDGASQGNLYHHAGSVLVEPDLLKQVSIYSGAGNALQGLGALNGSIQFETKNAFDVLKDGDHFYGLGKVTYYSNGEGLKVSNTLSGRLGDNWAALFSASYVDRNSYKDGDGNTVDLTDYTSENLLLKLSGRFDGGHSLDIGYEHFLSDTTSFDRINISQEFLDSTGRPTGLLQPIELSRDTYSLNYGYTPEDNDFIHVTAKAFYTTQGFERVTSGDKVDLQSTGLTLSNKSSLHNRFTTTYGFDIRKTESDVNYSELTPSSGSEEELAYGMFIQNDWEISNQFAVSFGGRYDVYDYDDYSGQNFGSSKFSPNTSVTFRPIEDLSLNLGYNEAFRGVGIREAFLAGSRPADQDGENAQTVKFSVAYDKNGFFARGSYFDQKIDNYLYPISEGGGGANGSFGDITNHGYELSVGYENAGFRTSLSVTDNSPEVEGYDYPDDLGVVIAGRQWIAEASYNFEPQGVTLGGNIELREKVEEVPFGGFPAISEKDSYTLVNTYVRWSVPNVSGLTLSLNVDNLFDESYQDHTIYASSGLASPGREFRLGASYEF